MTHRIERLPDGGYRVRLPAAERDLLRSLPGQLRTVLDDGGPSLARLFPPAHPDDPDAEEEYRGLVGAGLLRGQLAALETLERTADAKRLDEDELAAWLGALESLRLVLGTQLDVREDGGALPVAPDDPDAPRYALYGWLSWLQEEAVAALAAGLPG